uniref:Reverse transcriptase domain-containing protein n=1 Tax=Tanacetum cinerariifolium TaxID=118510 RepID=A0A6L2K5S4_TANCI|nr:reverse transcriptase domain-containing protein [Tanacetum cinerariifolium]
MVDSQLKKEEVRGTEMRDVGTEPRKRPTEPISQTQTTPSASPAFVKENIDVLRTMIKEHDHQAKAKATPKKLVYGNSERDVLDGSETKSFSDRFSLESSSTSDTRDKVRSFGKSQKSLPKDKELWRPRRIFATKSYAKDPTEIHGIKRRPSEGLQAFMDQFKFKSSHIKGFHPILRVSAFMHGHDPELAKKLNDKIPMTVDEMFKRVRAFIQGEVATGSAEMLKKQIKESVASRKLAHLGKDIRRGIQRNESQGMNGVKVIIMINGERNRKRPYKVERSSLTEELIFPSIPQNRLTDEPIILKGMIEGHQVNKMQVSVDRFLMRSIPSPRMRSLEAVGSTIHSMIKFPTDQRVIIMETSKEARWGCRQLEKMQSSWKEAQWRQDTKQMSRIREQTILRAGNNLGRRLGKEPIIPKKEEKKRTWVKKITICSKRPDQCITIESTLSIGWIIRRFQHPEWVTNATLVKLASDAWQLQMDYSSLNRICAKDMYPFSGGRRTSIPDGIHVQMLLTTPQGK